MVQILSQNSSRPVWLFICEEDGQSPRFMFDIRFFAESLKSRQENEAYDNFYFFASNPDAMKDLLKDRGIVTNKVFACSELETEIKRLENIPFLGCVVSSHGDINGVVNIKPNKIMDLIQNIPGLTDGLLLLGQCYSGIFNVPKQSKICVIGASNFCPSISSKFNRVDWVANIFLYYFAKWLKTPFDVDGDGQNTVLDAYKYASYYTDNELNSIKSNLSKGFHTWCTKEVEDLQSLSLKVIKNPADSGLMALYQDAQRRLGGRLSIYHNSQESWISDLNTALRFII